MELFSPDAEMIEVSLTSNMVTGDLGGRLLSILASQQKATLVKIVTTLSTW